MRACPIKKQTHAALTRLSTEPRELYYTHPGTGGHTNYLTHSHVHQPGIFGSCV